MNDDAKPYLFATARANERAKLLLDITGFMKTQQDIDLLVKWLEAFKGLLPADSEHGDDHVG